MVIIMKSSATKEQIDNVAKRIIDAGLKPHISEGEQTTLIGVIGDKTKLSDVPIQAMPGVDRTMPITAPYKLTSREFKLENTVVVSNDVAIGDKKIVTMAGPCAVESEEQIVTIAKYVKDTGAQFIRGGAFKPRTGPYSFQGLGKPGLEMLAVAKEETGLGIVTEVMTPDQVELVAEYTDILQLGARNMQNFYLLRAVGETQLPVLLKRGLSATIDEWLLAAEYIISEGNENVILCERGIRTYEPYTRNTLDLNAVAAVKELSHLPVVVDPSHGTGIRELVAPMSKASIAAGADGLLVEVHHDPDHSLTGDGVQSLLPKQFDALMDELRKIAEVIGREM